MKTRLVYLTISLILLLLTTYNIYGQTGSPEFKDTSQMITKEELFQERADNKARLFKERGARKRTKANAINTPKKKQNTRNTSKEFQKAYIEKISLKALAGMPAVNYKTVSMPAIKHVKLGSIIIS